MICYKDMTFCSRDCANKECKRNKKNIDKPTHLAWMPVAYSDFKGCEKFKLRQELYETYGIESEVDE